MKEIFDEYVKRFDMNDETISYKYYHSYRVMEEINKLTKSLNLNSYDSYIASIIGLFHDIGRFEQWTMYHTLKDEIIDHGLIGVRVLKEENILSKLNIKEEDYKVIYKSIENHNKYKIDKTLSERELLFTKMIRDADKLDILYALGNKDIKKNIRQSNDNLTKEVLEDFLNNENVSSKKVKNLNDGLILVFSFIYDINFKETFNILSKREYYDKIYERIVRKEIFEESFKHLKEYIKKEVI